MAPPTASPEGMLAQSGLDKRKPGLTTLEFIDHAEALQLRDGHAMSITGRSAIAPRDAALSNGGIAGVTIGCVVFVGLLLFCLYPIVVGRLKRRRHGPPPSLDAETAMAPGSLPPGQAQPEENRRLSSRDSLAQKRDALPGMERQSSKELTLGSLDGLDYVTTEEVAARHQRGIPAEQPVYHHPVVASRRQSGFTLGRLPTWQTDADEPISPGTIELVTTRADGLEYTADMVGQSASYYSPTIPSEAFGMVTPPPTDEAASPFPRRSSSRASSIKHNILALMRRMSSKDTPTSPLTTVGGAVGGPPSRTMPPPPPPQQLGISRELSESPVLYNSSERMPWEESNSAAAPEPGLASPIRFPPGPGHASAEDGQGHSRTDSDLGQRQSPPILPPPVPAPGTVNPMDIMAPSNDTEHAWRTNQQLYVNLHTSPTLNATPMMAPLDTSQSNNTEYAWQATHQLVNAHTSTHNPTSMMMQLDTSQSTTPRPPQSEEPSPYESDAPEQVQESNMLPSHYPSTTSVYDPAYSTAVRPVGITSYDPVRLMPTIPSHNGSLEGDSTDRSTPLPSSHVSSGPSTQTTPDTRGTDSSPSPRSDGSSDIRNSTSPYPPGFHSSPRSFTCDECGRAFDQVHKLNHHKRYHERPHECQHPNCGKKFGTKTHLDRHINDKHKKTRKYHCTEPTCAYSKAGGKSFPRKDNWRRHMMNIHSVNPRNDPEPDIIDDPMTGIKVEGEL